MNKLFSLTGLMVITSLIWTTNSLAEDTSWEVLKKESIETFAAFKDFSEEQRDEATEQASKAMDKLDKNINRTEEDLKEEWDDLSDESRKEKETVLADMREHRAQLGEWYDAMKSGSADAWKELSQGFSDAYSDLLDAWNSKE